MGGAHEHSAPRRADAARAADDQTRPTRAGQGRGNGDVLVALVEDHEVFAEALQLSLSAKGIDSVRVQLPISQTPGALVTAILHAKPAVVLLDLDLGRAGDGARLVRPLRRGGSRVVVLTASTDPIRWGGCLAQGAHAVMPKTAPLQDIVDGLFRTAHGLAVMPRGQREDFIGLWRARSTEAEEARTRLNGLTRREAVVLNELVRGKRVRVIAEEGFVSEATVRTQVKSILAKLGVNSQLAAVAMARDAGWGSSSDSP